MALERLKRPSVFRGRARTRRRCARQAARQAAQAGDRARALAEWDAVCADDDSPQNALDRIEAMRGGRRTTHARPTELARLDGHVDEVLRARAADAARRRDVCAAQTPTTTTPSRRCRSRSRRRGWRRSSATCRAGRRRRRARRSCEILAAPAGTRDAALDLVTLQKLADASAEHTRSSHYLLGRQLYGRGRFADAADDARTLARRAAAGRRFIREAVRLRGGGAVPPGQARRGARDLPGALVAIPTASEGARLERPMWVARCDFKMP